MRIAIIGAGHNGLVCAAYIAKNGHDVVVYERSSIVGGLCVTEELFPGFRVSSVASQFGMLRKEVIEDLALAGFGLRAYVTDPSRVVLLPEGRYLVESRSGSTHFEFEVTERDRSGWTTFWSEVTQAASIMGQFLLRTGVTQYELQQEIAAVGLKSLAERLFDGSLADLVGEYFESPLLKAAVCSTVYELPTRKGTIFNCIYSQTAQAGGKAGATGLIKGGMGVLTHVLQLVCESHGVVIHTNSTVRKIMVEKRKATGVELADGRKESFDAVISNADPRTTFGRLLDESVLPEPLKKTLKTPVGPVSSGKVHMALSHLPEIPALQEVAQAQAGTIVLAPGFEQLVSSSDQLMKGQMPESLLLSLSFPSVTDETVAPAGKHLLTVDISHLPLLCNGQPWNDSNSSIILDSVMASIEVVCPRLSQAIEATAVITPGHLQDRFGVSTGHCSHLPMTSDHLVEKRRFPYCGQHTTPIEKLYLCGAGTFPGGGVSGAPGYNCARIFRSIRRQRK